LHIFATQLARAIAQQPLLGSPWNHSEIESSLRTLERPGVKFAIWGSPRRLHSRSCFSAVRATAMESAHLSACFAILHALAANRRIITSTSQLFFSCSSQSIFQSLCCRFHPPFKLSHFRDVFNLWLMIAFVLKPSKQINPRSRLQPFVRQPNT
jgi:hypothetical protein